MTVYVYKSILSFRKRGENTMKNRNRMIAGRRMAAMTAAPFA